MQHDKNTTATQQLDAELPEESNASEDLEEVKSL